MYDENSESDDDVSNTISCGKIFEYDFRTAIDEGYSLDY
jgi:hypothetical protein